jgi:hypothetical protein
MAARRMLGGLGWGVLQSRLSIQGRWHQRECTSGGPSSPSLAAAGGEPSSSSQGRRRSGESRQLRGALVGAGWE